MTVVSSLDCVIFLSKRIDQKEKITMCDSVELIKGFVRNNMGWLVVFFNALKKPTRYCV